MISPELTSKIRAKGADPVVKAARKVAPFDRTIGLGPRTRFFLHGLDRKTGEIETTKLVVRSRVPRSHRISRRSSACAGTVAGKTGGKPAEPRSGAICERLKLKTTARSHGRAQLQEERKGPRDGADGTRAMTPLRLGSHDRTPVR